MKPFLLWILLVISLSACTGAMAAPDSGELADVARAGLAVVERGGSPVVVVLRNERRPAVRAAMARLRRVIRPEEVPETAGYSLPAGYFYLDRLEIQGDTAVFQGQLGPLFADVPKPGLLSMNCGTVFTVALRKSQGKWSVGDVSLTMC